MDCPDCGCITRVIEINSYSDRVLRRRECRGCGARFTTEEGQASGPTTFEDERQWLYEAAEALETAAKGLEAAQSPVGELRVAGLIDAGATDDVDRALRHVQSVLDTLLRSTRPPRD